MNMNYEIIKKIDWEQVAHTFNSCTCEVEADRSLWFWGYPDLQVSSRTARATQKNPVLKNKTKQNKTTPKKKEKEKSKQ